MTLKNGKVLEGKVRREGGRVIIQTAAGELSLEASEVKEIDAGPSAQDLYLEKRKSVKGADGHLDLGDWCKDNDLRKEARRHWRKAIEIDTDHEDARDRLGFVREDGKWMTRDEAMEAKGLVKVKGKWIPRADGRRADSDRALKAAQKKHVKKIRDCVRRMASRKRAVRLKAFRCFLG